MLGTRLFEEIVNIFMTMMTAGDQVLTENERLFRLGKIGNGQKKNPRGGKDWGKNCNHGATNSPTQSLSPGTAVPPCQASKSSNSSSTLLLIWGTLYLGHYTLSGNKAHVKL